MPNKHANPHLGWNPPAEVEAWVRGEAERRGVPYSSVLNDALAHERARPDLPAVITAAITANVIATWHTSDGECHEIYTDDILGAVSRALEQAAERDQEAKGAGQ